MPEFLQGKALKWFISKNKLWRARSEFLESFQAVISLSSQIR